MPEASRPVLFNKLDLTWRGYVAPVYAFTGFLAATRTYEVLATLTPLLKCPILLTFLLC